MEDEALLLGYMHCAIKTSFKCRLNDIRSAIIGECREWSKDTFVRSSCACGAHRMRI